MFYRLSIKKNPEQRIRSNKLTRFSLGIIEPNCFFFQFQLPLNEVENRTMWLTVWHSDMFGRNDFLGEVMLPLSGVPMDDPTPRWFNLQDRVSSKAIQRRSAMLHGII